MRTTVNVDEHVLATAKRRARERGITLGEYVEQALRDESTKTDPAPAPSIPVFHGTGLRPGVDLSSNRAIQELLDEGVPLDKLR